MHNLRTLPGFLVLAGALSCTPSPPPSSDGGITTPTPDAGGSTPRTGEKGGACYGNGACDPGLDCRDDVCVVPSAAAQGEEGGACYGNGTCNAGLDCRDDVCVVPSAAEQGEEGGACYGNGTCNAGLDCRDDVCVSSSQADAGPDAGTDGGTDGGTDAGPPPVITAFTADDEAVVLGENTTLRWATTGALTCILEPDFGDVLVNGSQPIQPLASTDYELTCTNEGGSTSASISVGLLPPAITAFTASPPTIDYGTSATLSWTSSGADTCTIQPGIGEVSASGSREVSPEETTLYELTCSHPEDTASATVELSVNPPVRITSFTSSAESVPLRTSVTLTWETTDATSCTLDGEPVAVSGTADVLATAWPEEPNTYTLSCEGIAGPATSTVTVMTSPPVVYDGTIVVCGPATVCNIDNAIINEDGTTNPGGFTICPEQPQCTPRGGDLSDLAAANVVTGAVVLSGVEIPPGFFDRLVEAKDVVLQDVTVQGDLAFPSLRSVQANFTVAYGGTSHLVSGDLDEVRLPALESVSGYFAVVRANVRQISAPQLTEAGTFWVRENESSKCLSLDFPLLSTVTGADHPPLPEFPHFWLRETRSSSLVFPSLSRVNGWFSVVDRALTQSAAEAAFPALVETAGTYIFADASQSCP